MTNPLIHIHADIAGKLCDVYLRKTAEQQYKIVRDTSVQDIVKERILPFLDQGEDIESRLQKLQARNIIIQRSEDAQKAFEIDSYLRRMQREYHLTGTVLIKKSGEEFFCESYGDDNREDSRYCIGSMSKMMTACAIMKIIQDPDIKIELDDKMNQHLPPEYRHPLFEQITIRHLLNHTSGLPLYGSLPEENERTKPFNFNDLYQCTLLMCFIHKKALHPNEMISSYLPKEYQDRYRDITAEELMTHQLGKDDQREKYQKIDELYQFILTNLEHLGGGLLFKPGESRSYSNAGYVFLGEILKYKTGKSYEEYMKSQIFSENGIKMSDYTEFSGTIEGSYPEAKMEIHLSKANAAGEWITTVRDLEKFDRLLYDDDFLSKETREQMFRENLGFEVRKGPNGKMVGHPGGIVGYNSYMTRNVDTRDLFVILENRQLEEEEGKENALTITRHLETIFYR